MKQFAKAIIALSASFALLFAGAVPASAYASSKADNRIYDQTNAARKAEGLPLLVLDEKLTKVAQDWSAQQARENKMYHNPNYAEEIPAGWTLASENVAAGYAPDKVVEGWMNSEGHRANILSQVTSVGIGMAKAEDGTPYYTQVFANYPKVSAPSPEPEPKPVETTKPAPEPVKTTEPAPKETKEAVETPPKSTVKPKEATTPKSETKATVKPTEPQKSTLPSLEERKDAADTSVKIDATDTSEENPEENIVSTQDIPHDALIGPEAPQEETDDSQGLLIALAITSGVLLVGAIVALILLRRRST